MLVGAWRAGGLRHDHIDIGGCQARVANGGLYGEDQAAIGLALGHITLGVVRGSEARDVCINRYAALDGAFALFEDEQSAAFAGYAAWACGVERPDSCFGVG